MLFTPLRHIPCRTYAVGAGAALTASYLPAADWRQPLLERTLNIIV